MTAVLVVLGAAVGAPSRYLISRALQAPWGIVVVNLLGCLAMGLLMGSTPPVWLASLAGVGFCGAFTTFSTFALDAVELVESGAWRTATLHVGGSVLGGVAVFTLGFWVAGLF